MCKKSSTMLICIKIKHSVLNINSIQFYIKTMFLFGGKTCYHFLSINVGKLNMKLLV